MRFYRLCISFRLLARFNIINRYPYKTHPLDGYSSSNFTVSSEEKTMIQELNRLDMKLYERAQEIFEARWQDMLEQTPQRLREERFVPFTKMTKSGTKRGPQTFYRLRKPEVNEEKKKPKGSNHLEIISSLKIGGGHAVKDHQDTVVNEEIDQNTALRLHNSNQDPVARRLLHHQGRSEMSLSPLFFSRQGLLTGRGLKMVSYFCLVLYAYIHTFTAGPRSGGLAHSHLSITPFIFMWIAVGAPLICKSRMETDIGRTDFSPFSLSRPFTSLHPTPPYSHHRA